MPSQSQEEALTSREFFTKSEEVLAQEDLLQASEKGWGRSSTGGGVAQSKG